MYIAVQLATVEEALAARKAELGELLASHKAVQLAKDQAKADLSVVEQELRGGRAARDAQLQQHSALVSVLHHYIACTCVNGLRQQWICSCNDLEA